MNLKTLVANLRRDADELESLDRMLSGLGSGNTAKTVSIASGKPKKPMSAAARKKIAAAQRARWAKVRAGKKG
jgi:hypothetical protein